MAVTVTNSFNNTDSWDANKVNTNFSDLLTWANGGITTAHLSASAGITNAQLANKDFVFAIPINMNNTWDLSTSTNTSVGTAGLPYIGSDTWTVIGYSWYVSDSGSNDGQFSVGWYTRTGTSIVSNETAILGSTTITSYDGSTTNVEGYGKGSLNIDITTTSSKTGFFSVQKVTHGTNVLNAGYKVFNVTLFVKRKSGLGSF